VVGAGPHDSGATVPYHPIRTILLSLLGADEADLFRRSDELQESAPLVAAGMRELLDPSGLRGSEHHSRASAVAAALAHAISHALESMSRGRMLLIVDDLHRCDGLSAQVLGQLPQHSGNASVLVLTASAQTREPSLPADTQIVPLRGLTMSEARAYMGGYQPLYQTTGDPAAEERAFVPLYLEQLRALGLAVDGVPHTLPRRLADVVAQRVQRLSLSARRVLQVASVLGNRSGRALVLRLAEIGDDAGLELLKGVGLLVEQEGQVEIVHPFVRDLVEASIPAEARKALHARALEAAADADAQLEVRAHHAYGAGETLTALMLLERMGDLAFDRGDPGSAVLAYRRCLDLVRRELLESGDTSLEEAMGSFSRKLGNALAHGGDVTGAEGVLREALEFCGPGHAGRALILLSLGRVVAARKRQRDGYRMLGEALEIAIQRDDDLMQAYVHMAVGELRRSEGNVVGAVGSFSSALQRLNARGADDLAIAKAAVELAITLAQGSDQSAAAEALQRADQLAAEAEAPYLQARVAAALAGLRDAQSNAMAAQLCWQQAWQAAVRAGDGEGAARLARSLERPANAKDTELPLA
jgi:tetratricopeptide (TPR) repeat protein